MPSKARSWDDASVTDRGRDRDRGGRAPCDRDGVDLRKPLALLLAVSLFAACALSSSGLSSAPAECAVAAECDDANPCTVDGCSSEGRCTHASAATAPDDLNPCTVDTCTGGVETHDPAPDETPCYANGKCEAGACVVACTSDGPADQCDDDNACTSDACNLAIGQCAWLPLDGPTPGVTQLVGDCQVDRCEQGVHMADAPDDADVPPDQPCAQESCQDGEPVTTFDPAGTSCGPSPLQCDGNGNCQGCTSAGQCPDVNPCATPTCTASVCGSDPLPAGTAPPFLQQPGDCVQLVCDGGGGLTQTVDNSDAPGSDGNECTQDVCVGGTPQHLPDPGAPCGSGQFCNNLGNCVDCVGNVQCSDGEPCNGDEKCGAAFTCEPGDPLVCADDGNPCTSEACQTGVGCMSTPLDGVPCLDGDVCNGDETCIAGACSPGIPLSCTPGVCQAALACNPVTGCTFGNAPNGTPCPDADLCNGAETCQNGACAAGPPVSCPNDNNACTEDVCNPVTGTCGIAEPDGTPCGSCACASNTTTKHLCSSGSCATTTATCTGCMPNNCCP